MQRGSDIVGAYGDNFGIELNLSTNGNILAVAAKSAGYLRVFEWNGSSWAQKGSDLTFAQGWYPSVSMTPNGAKIAVSNMLANSSTGEVLVYGWNGTTWSQLGSTLNGSEPGSLFGEVVSLSGNGFYLGVKTSGAVKVYQYDENASDWNLFSTVTAASSTNQFGKSIAFSTNADVLLIGDPGYAMVTGAIFRYVQGPGVYSQLPTVLSGPSQFSQFGFSISYRKYGTRIAVGSYQENGYSGAVRVYDWDYTTNNWRQIGSTITGEAIEYFGSTVALDNDGVKLAVSGLQSPGSATLNGQFEVFDLVTDMEPQYAIIHQKDIETATAHHEISGGITLSSGDALLLRASTDDVIISVFGTEISESAEITYKILGQEYVGLTTTITPGTSGSGYYYGGGGTEEVIDESLSPVTMYTVPSGKQAIISSVFATNHDTVERTYDLALVPAGDELSTAHHVRWDYPVNSDDFDMVSSKFTLAAGDKVIALPSTADKIGFTVFGVEVDA